MPITIDGTGTIAGISAGGLPTGVVTTDEIAAGAVTTAKLGSNEASGLCKAWVNFNGTGTVAIRASYNVSSITDNGVGSYTVNFATAMPDGNYSPQVIARRPDDVLSGSWFVQLQNSGQINTTGVHIATIFASYTNPSVATDSTGVYVSIFR